MINKKKRLPGTPHVNILKGKVRCNKCGKTLSLSIRNDRTVYGGLSCSTYRRYGKTRCTSHYITYDYLVDYIKEKINKTINLTNLGEKRFYTKMIKTTSLSQKKTNLEKSLESYTSRMKAIDVLIKKLFEKYVHEKITEDKFYELDKSYDEEKLWITKSIKNIEVEIQSISKKINEISAFFDLVSNYEEITELSREDILKLIDKVVIKEKKGKNKKRLVDVYFVLIGKM